MRWPWRRRPMLSREQMAFVAVLEAVGVDRRAAVWWATSDPLRAALTGEELIRLAVLSARCSATMALPTESRG